VLGCDNLASEAPKPRRLARILRGKIRDVHPVMHLISLLFLIYFLRTFLGVDL
jgi:hypothetical protein